MRTIFTPLAPKPAGHYSQAIEHQGTIYVSGQLPIDSKTAVMIDGTIEDQCSQVLNNILGILESANSDFAHVLKMTVYISDISLWSQVNTIYSHYFAQHKPARIIVPTGPLHHGASIEMDCIAVVKN